jgi:hypothetical protein
MTLSKRLFCISLVSVGLVSGCGSTLSKNTPIPTSSDAKPMESGGIKQWSFFCDPSGLTTEERKRWLSLHEKLRTSREEVRELPDGYSYRYRSDAGTIKEVAEFITFERRCCPFFDFDVSVERDGGALWMSLKGANGVKAFIRSEFGT